MSNNLNRDFDNWLTWYRRTHQHTSSSLSDDEMRVLYDSHYSCECVTCVYRKEKGAMPINTGRPDCTVPIGVIAEMS